MESADKMSEDRVAKTFVGKNVLISGATGFLGKAFLEKLLRVCPEVGGVILIVRPKKGKEPKQRVEEIFDCPLFEPLVSSRSKEQLLCSVTAVTGDMIEKDLGLSEKDRAICQSADIIVHSAATVRFDEGLRRAVLLNTRGTRYMLDLAKECPKLELFVHVSTSYCHPEQKILEEELYPTPHNPHDVINIMETTDEAEVIAITPKLLGDCPNTYTFSKALGESLVEEAMAKIPAVIVRPSVVVAPLFEPIVGWMDNINGPTGLLIAAGKGVLRTMYGDENSYVDLAPVDYVVSAMMVTIWDCIHNGGQPKVLNLTTSDARKVRWKEVLDAGREIVCTKVPFDIVLWYPGGSMTTRRWLHNVRAVFYHWIPAILVDILLFCLGYKPVLMRVHNKISKNCDMLEYYVNNEWRFKHEKTITIRNKLNELEKKKYMLYDIGLDLHNYFEHAALWARRGIVKEPDENLPRARLQIKILWFLDWVVKIMFWCYIIYWLSQKITSVY